MDDDLIATQFDQPARGLEDDAEIGTPTIDDSEPATEEPVAAEPAESSTEEPTTESSGSSPAPIPMSPPVEEQSPVLRYEREAPRQAYRPPPNPPDYQPPGFDADAIHVTGTTGAIRDEAAKVREGKVPATQLKKEETLEHSWRQILGDLDTTEFCHIKLWRRAPDNSYKRLGALYNTDISMVRGIERLIPYGDGTNQPVRYVVEVAKGDVREDSAKGWRKFTFERIGPAPPLGWSLDSPYNVLDQEVENVDMGTIQQLGEELLRRFQQGGVGGAPQQNLNPHGGQQGQFDPMMMMRLEEERRERQRREEEARRREEDERKRIRDDEERLRRERLQVEDDRRKEREALQAQMQVVTAQVAAAEQRAREAEERAKEREREMQVQRQFDAAANQINELKALVASNATRPPEKTSLDALLPVISTVVPVIGAIIQNGQVSRAEESRNRMAQLEAESRQRAAEADRLGQFVTSTAQQQLEYSRTMTDVLMKASDPSGTLSVAKMAGESMMSSVTMIANLAKTGLLGGAGGGGGGINIGELIAQGVESVPQIIALIMQMQERKAAATAAAVRDGARRPALSGAMEAMYGQGGGEDEADAEEDQPPPPMSRPQPRPQPNPQAPRRRPGVPAATRQPDSPPPGAPAAPPPPTIPVEEMERRKGEVRGKVRAMDLAATGGGDPEILADSIFVLIQAAVQYGFDKIPGGLATFIHDLGIDPYSLLRRRYVALPGDYVRAVVDVLIKKYGLTPQILESPDAGEADEDGKDDDMIVETVVEPPKPAPAVAGAAGPAVTPPRRRVTIKLHPRTTTGSSPPPAAGSAPVVESAPTPAPGSAAVVETPPAADPRPERDGPAMEAPPAVAEVS